MYGFYHDKNWNLISEIENSKERKSCASNIVNRDKDQQSISKRNKKLKNSRKSYEMHWKTAYMRQSAEWIMAIKKENHCLWWGTWKKKHSIIAPKEHKLQSFSLCCIIQEEKTLKKGTKKMCQEKMLIDFHAMKEKTNYNPWVLARAH